MTPIAAAASSMPVVGMIVRRKPAEPIETAIPVFTNVLVTTR